MTVAHAAGVRRPPFLLLILVVALGPLSLNIFVPSMPGMQRVFATEYGNVQLTLSLYFVAFAAMQLVYGPLSDRFGRRPILLVGLGIFLAGNLTCFLASSIGMLIAGRVVQAVGVCAGYALVRAIIRDVYQREQAASQLAYMTMAMVLVPMVAPAIGGYLDIWYGWQANFLFVMGAGGLALAYASAALNETNHRRQPLGGVADLAASYRALFRDRAFCGYAIQVGCTTGTFFTFVGGAPYVMVEVLGRTPSDYGLYFMAVAGCFMAGNFISGRFTMRLGLDRMILTGCLLAVVGVGTAFGFALAGVLTPATLFAPIGLMSLGNGFSVPNGVAGAVSVNPGRAGAASGASGFLQMTVGAVGTYVVGLLLEDSGLPLLAAMLITATGALLAHFLGVRGAHAAARGG